MPPPKLQNSSSDSSSTTAAAGANTAGSGSVKGEASATAANNSTGTTTTTTTTTSTTSTTSTTTTDSAVTASTAAKPSSSQLPSSSSSNSHSSTSTPSSYSVLPRMSDPTPPPSSATNVPSSAAASSSRRPARESGVGASDASRDNAASAPGGTPSPYGTRSRNRTGGARPNYAEDKDIDVEIFEIYPERREDEPRKPPSRSAATSGTNASVSAAAALEREPLRPTNGSSGNSHGNHNSHNSQNSHNHHGQNGHSSGNSGSHGNHSGNSGSSSGNNNNHNHSSERIRKPLPTGTGSNADSNQSSSSSSNSSSNNNNSSSSSSGKSASSASSSHPKDPKDQNGASAASTNGGTNPRKRKAATSNDKSSNGSSTAQSAPGSSHASSQRKSGASLATAAAAARGSSKGYSNTNLLTFEKRAAKPSKDGKMIADDGTVLSVNDHVYLVCEPPGEPYYLARIMEFLHAKNNPSLPVDALRVNWYYRPRDIARKAQDTRSVFATMHSDTTPLTALRGKCTIKHKTEITNFDEFRKTTDCFWFEKLYDRYIQKNYEVIPTTLIVNVPERVKKVLHERWRYVLVEQGRGKELTAAAKQCKRCNGYCANNNSVDCAVCTHTYHMNCVRPPLLKKPSRGFAWSCAACSRAQERLLEARHTPNVIDGRTPDTITSQGTVAGDDEDFDEDEDAHGDRTSPEEEEDAHPPATAEQKYQASLWPYRYLGMHCKVEDALDYDDRIYPRAATRVGPRHQAVVGPWPGRPVQYVMPPDIKKATRREARQNKEALAAYERQRESRPKWIQDTPAGYVERGLDLDEDDENCTSWLVYKGSPHAGSAKPTADEDSSKMDLDPPEDDKEQQDKEKEKEPETDDACPISPDEIDQFMGEAVSRAGKLGLPSRSTNLYDMACKLLYRHGFDTKKALEDLEKQDIKEFKEPSLSSAELRRFEEAVGKFGSELLFVKRHVKTVFYGDIVRFYYTWKKTDRGKQIWGNNASRKGKKEAKEAKKAEAAAASKFQDDVADDNDDSAFDTDKAESMKRQFQCKFCHTKSSRQWRRAPAAAPTGVLSETLGSSNSKNSHRDRSQTQQSQQYVMSLCRRCAELWRRYAVQWEDTEALQQKAAAVGARLLKRKIDEEIFKEIGAADELMRLTDAHYNALHPPTPTRPPSAEPPRKRVKGHSSANGNREGDRDGETNASDSAASSAPPPSSSNRRKDRSDKAAAGTTSGAADKAAEKTAAASGKAGTIAESSKGGAAKTEAAVVELRKLPCAICYQMELPTADQMVCCRDCRLTVHRSCYGVLDVRNPAKWLCDMCTNDRNPQVSIDYRCVLCPVVHTEHDFLEPPRAAHKKKTDKDRERERAERDQAQKAVERYQRRQLELSKPISPREALKRTADNNWVHATCAVWTPEVKFGNAHALEPSEGIPSVPRSRYGEECRVCRGTTGACVACHQCRMLFHVECAHQAGYIFGFDLVPIKGSRRDQTNVVTANGVTGLLTAAIWCPEHVPLKNSVHLTHEMMDGNDKTALQLYVDHYKQADLALTGCARKANLLTLAAKMSGMPMTAVGSSNGSPGADGISGSAGNGSSNANGSSNGNGSSGRRSSLYLNGSSHGSSNGNGYSNGNGHHSHSMGVRSLTPEPLRPGGKICFTCGTDVSPKWHTIDKAQERELMNGFFDLGEEARKFVAQRNFQCHKCKKMGRQPQPQPPAQPTQQPLPPQQSLPPQQPPSQMQQPPPSQQSHESHLHHRHYSGPYSGSVKTEEDLYSDVAIQRLVPQYQQHPAQASQPPPPSLQPPLRHGLHQPQQPLPHSHLHQPQQPVSHSHLHQPQHPNLRPPVMHPSYQNDHLHAQSSAAALAPPPPTASQTAGPALPSMTASPDRSRYWQTTSNNAGATSSSASSLAPPPPPPLTHHSVSGPPPSLSMRQTPGGSPPPLHPPVVHHASHSPPMTHPRATILPPRTGPPPPPLSTYGSASASSMSGGYGDWRRPASNAATGPPPASNGGGSGGSSRNSIPPLAHNHLRPPPLTISHQSTALTMSGMQNGYGSGSNSGSAGPGMINGRPPSPRSSSSRAASYGHGSPYGQLQSGAGAATAPSSASPPMSSSRMANGGSSSHMQFSQVLNPQRSMSSSASSAFDNVTREDFTTLGRDRNQPRPSSETRTGSAASSNPSLRNLLS